MGTPAVFELMIGKVYGLGIFFERMSYVENTELKHIFDVKINFLFVTLYIYPRKTRDNRWFSLVAPL